jgi:hypothetical protein
MMTDIGWLTNEARNLHNYFTSLYYALVTLLLVLGIIIEYFRLPIGGVPSAGILVGRALVATILLVSYNEIANGLGQVADSVAKDLGNLDKLDGVLKKMGEKIDAYSGDWLNARTLIITAMSILTYTFLFYSVFIAEVAHIFTWTLLYVFSPVLIAMFVLPATSTATKALFRSIVEVACWKIVWAVLSALLWASVLVDLSSESTMDFVKLICINLVLGGSLIATPWVVHALCSAGLASFTRNFGGLATAAGVLTPGNIIQKTRSIKNRSIQGVSTATNFARKGVSVSAAAALFARNPIRNTQSFLSAVRSDANSGISKAKWVLSAKPNAAANPGVAKHGGLPWRDRSKATSSGDVKPHTSWQRYQSMRNDGGSAGKNKNAKSKSTD